MFLATALRCSRLYAGVLSLVLSVCLALPASAEPAKAKLPKKDVPIQTSTPAQGVLVKYDSVQRLHDEEFLDLIDEWEVASVVEVFVEEDFTESFSNVFLFTPSVELEDPQAFVSALQQLPGVEYAFFNTDVTVADFTLAVNESEEVYSPLATADSTEFVVEFESRDGPAVMLKNGPDNLKIISLAVPNYGNGTITLQDAIKAMIKAVQYTPKKIQMAFDLPEDVLTPLVMMAQPGGTLIIDLNGEIVLPYGGNYPFPEILAPVYRVWVTQSVVLDAEYVTVYWSHAPSVTVSTTDYVALFNQNGTQVSWIRPATQTNVTGSRYGQFQFQVPGTGNYSGTFHFRYCPATGGCYASSNTFSVQVGTPVVISGVSVVDITGTTARFTWTTNRVSTSRVGLGQDPFFRPERPIDHTPVLSHSYRVTNGMYPFGTFYYHVKSNSSSSPVGQFNTTGQGDTTPPIISNVNITPGRTTVDVSWTTNEAADSKFTYWYFPNPTTRVERSYFTNQLVLNHQIPRQYNLAPNSQYSYRIESRDTSLNSRLYPAAGPGQFQTLP